MEGWLYEGQLFHIMAKGEGSYVKRALIRARALI